MNRLTSTQRKLVYFIGIIVLLAPIMWLGRPAGAESEGGKLAQLRAAHDLGEANLGQVDPSSATMNLVLLGLRGVAANLLWLDALDQQERKNWSQLKSNVESIILLQPHFLQVWRHQGWNLAYNVSSEWDGVSDRYYWVKEGAKFLIRGSGRNEIFPELPHDVGSTLGKKIGRSDEWRQFRKFFKEQDPDEKRFSGEPDTELNPRKLDNYLVAYDWFVLANERELLRDNTKMARVLFRQYPARSLINYPYALQRDGTFGEITERGWTEASEFWTDVYGKERYKFSFGEVYLEASDEEIAGMAQEYDTKPEIVEGVIERLKSVANYNYWKTRSRIEATPEMVEAHRSLYEGQKLFREGNYNDREIDGKLVPSEAQLQIEEGLVRFQELFKNEPKLLDESDAIDEVLLSIICWHQIHQLNVRPVPENFTLKSLWIREQHRLPNLNNIFRAENKVRN